MDESDDDMEWTCLAEGIVEAVSEAVSDEFPEYARASILHDLGGMCGWEGVADPWCKACYRVGVGGAGSAALPKKSHIVCQTICLLLLNAKQYEPVNVCQTI